MGLVLFSKEKGFSMWFAAVLSALVNVGFSAWIIYGVADYGIALFIFIPLLIGLYSVLLHGYKKRISFADSRDVAWFSLGLYAAIIFMVAMEGIICIAMAMPFAILFTWLGSLLGTLFVKMKGRNAAAAIVVITLAVPFTSFVEKDIRPDITSVTTSVVIDASPEEVWPHLVSFPPLPAPNEIIFRAGIAYPTDARMDGRGVGAVRHCNFTTGSFVEPITTWDEPNLLAFDVKEQPAPLRELSFWDIDAPHLHDYFISKKGQFKLTRLEDNQTLLEGTTWYSHDIKPEFYWRPWSTYIIHKIHERVLKHIKRNAER